MRRAILLLAVSSAVLAAPPESLEQRLARAERQAAQVPGLVLSVERLERANRKLVGRVEELEYRLRRMEKKQRELYLDLDERLSRLEKARAGIPPAAGASQPPAAPAEPPAAAGHAPAPAPQASPEQIRAEYDAAYALLQPSQRKYDQAIAAFKAFLDKYPKSDLADNALYWLGEAYYVTGDNAKALEAFQRLLDRFPKSEKVPGALLKKGYILAAQGHRKEARQVLESLIRKYPDAAVARMAKVRLGQLGKGR